MHQAILKNLNQVKSLAVVGCTGLVGQELLSLFEAHHVALTNLSLFASEDSCGMKQTYRDKTYSVQALARPFPQVQFAFFSTPTPVAHEWVPQAMAAGGIVIDDSTAFRMEPHVPLIVPEINQNALLDGKARAQLVATPNCVVVPLALSLYPLQERYGLERVVVSTYQSVSGAGKRLMKTLSTQSAALLQGKSLEAKDGEPHPFAFNCIPLIGKVTDTDFSEEEAKIEGEIQKILELPELPVHATAVRVPVFSGHALSVTVAVRERPASGEQLREVFDRSPGVHVLDQPRTHIYPTPQHSVGTDIAWVGRIRIHSSERHVLSYWIACDNIRKGSALNAAQIIDALLANRSASSRTSLT